MRKPIATPSRTKEILAAYDMFAKKGYGQNFLIEPSVVDKIARAALTEEPCVVFEIGPGIGALTEYLCTYASHVVSFEIDERLPVVLHDTLQAYHNYEIVLQDFLTIDLSAWVQRYRAMGYSVVIAANLPYYITTPILFKIFASGTDIAAITVMMQKEVADRFYANVNTKEYNALSVITQYRCHVQQVMKVSRHVFMPQPKVDSTVLQFRFNKHSDKIDTASFFRMVKACFKQRRKTMLNNLGEYFDDKENAHRILGIAGIDVSRRAESLELNQFLHLYEVIQNEGTSVCEN